MFHSFIIYQLSMTITKEICHLQKVSKANHNASHNSLNAGSFLMLLLMSSGFFKIYSKKKRSFRNTTSECQTVWIQTRTDALSVLNRVQTGCKSYQQMTKVVASKKRVHKYFQGNLSFAKCIEHFLKRNLLCFFFALYLISMGGQSSRITLYIIFFC